MNDGIIIFMVSAVLLTAAVTDLRSQRIPNWLTFPAFLLGLAYHAGQQGMQGVFFSLEGAAAGIALLLVPYLMGGMGAGDAKLMGAVGSLLGPKMVLTAFLFTAIVGGAYAILVLAQKKLLRDFLSRCRAILTLAVLTRRLPDLPATKAPACPPLRYGLAIALGTLIAILVKSSPLFSSVQMISM
jgi:prepilin peptidase CpaA